MNHKADSDNIVAVTKKPSTRKPIVEKRPSSFWIPRESVEALLRQRASAVQIGAYLTIAKHTDKFGRISTTGTTALRNRLGLGDKQIHAALGVLQGVSADFKRGSKGRNRLIYDAATWNELVTLDSEDVDADHPGFALLSLATFYKSKRVRNCWVINNVGTDRHTGIWFNSTLIGKNSDKVKPLADIIRLHNSDSIMRFLLLMHYNYDLDIGGIDPFHIRGAYEQIESKQVEGYIFRKYKYSRGVASEKIMRTIHSYVMGLDTEYKEAPVHEFMENALETLDRLGLISRIVMGWSKEYVGGDSVPLYQLDQKSKFRQISRDKSVMMADQIEKVAHNFGMRSSKGNKGFYDTYTIVTPAGISPSVVHIYKPTHAVHHYQRAYPTRLH